MESYESQIDGYDVINTYISAEYTITYDLNGGSFEGKTGIIEEIHTEGEEIYIHGAPVRSGYSFVFWKGSVYYPEERYEVIESHTFTAVWKKESPDPEPPYVPPRTGINQFKMS